MFFGDQQDHSRIFRLVSDAKNLPLRRLGSIQICMLTTVCAKCDRRNKPSEAVRCPTVEIRMGVIEPTVDPRHPTTITGRSLRGGGRSARKPPRQAVRAASVRLALASMNESTGRPCPCPWLELLGRGSGCCDAVNVRRCANAHGSSREEACRRARGRTATRSGGVPA